MSATKSPISRSRRATRPTAADAFARSAPLLLGIVPQSNGSATWSKETALRAIARVSLLNTEDFNIADRPSTSVPRIVITPPASTSSQVAAASPTTKTAIIDPSAEEAHEILAPIGTLASEEGEASATPPPTLPLMLQGLSGTWVTAPTAANDVLIAHFSRLSISTNTVDLRRIQERSEANLVPKFTPYFTPSLSSTSPTKTGGHVNSFHGTSTSQFNSLNIAGARAWLGRAQKALEASRLGGTTPHLIPALPLAPLTISAMQADALILAPLTISTVQTDALYSTASMGIESVSCALPVAKVLHKFAWPDLWNLPTSSFCTGYDPHALYKRIKSEYEKMSKSIKASTVGNAGQNDVGVMADPRRKARNIDMQLSAPSLPVTPAKPITTPSIDTSDDMDDVEPTTPTSSDSDAEMSEGTPGTSIGDMDDDIPDAPPITFMTPTPKTGGLGHFREYSMEDSNMQPASAADFESHAALEPQSQTSNGLGACGKVPFPGLGMLPGTSSSSNPSAARNFPRSTGNSVDTAMTDSTGGSNTQPATSGRSSSTMALMPQVPTSYGVAKTADLSIPPFWVSPQTSSSSNPFSSLLPAHSTVESGDTAMADSTGSVNASVAAGASYAETTTPAPPAFPIGLVDTAMSDSIGGANAAPPTVVNNASQTAFRPSAASFNSVGPAMPAIMKGAKVIPAISAGDVQMTPALSNAFDDAMQAVNTTDNAALAPSRMDTMPKMGKMHSAKSSMSKRHDQVMEEAPASPPTIVGNSPPISLASSSPAGTPTLSTRATTASPASPVSPHIPKRKAVGAEVDAASGDNVAGSSRGGPTRDPTPSPKAAIKAPEAPQQGSKRKIDRSDYTPDEVNNDFKRMRESTEATPSVGDTNATKPAEEPKPAKEPKPADEPKAPVPDLVQGSKRGRDDDDDYDAPVDLSLSTKRQYHEPPLKEIVGKDVPPVTILSDTEQQALDNDAKDLAIHFGSYIKTCVERLDEAGLPNDPTLTRFKRFRLYMRRCWGHFRDESFTQDHWSRFPIGFKDVDFSIQTLDVAIAKLRNIMDNPSRVVKYELANDAQFLAKGLRSIMAMPFLNPAKLATAVPDDPFVDDPFAGLNESEIGGAVVAFCNDYEDRQPFELLKNKENLKCVSWWLHHFHENWNKISEQVADGSPETVDFAYGLYMTARRCEGICDFGSEIQLRALLNAARDIVKELSPASFNHLLDHDAGPNDFQSVVNETADDLRNLIKRVRPQEANTMPTSKTRREIGTLLGKLITACKNIEQAWNLVLKHKDDMIADDGTASVERLCSLADQAATLECRYIDRKFMINWNMLQRYVKFIAKNYDMDALKNEYEMKIDRYGSLYG